MSRVAIPVRRSFTLHSNGDCGLTFIDMTIWRFRYLRSIRTNAHRAPETVGGLGRNPHGPWPVVRSVVFDCASARCGLTFILLTGKHLKKTNTPLKINPHQPMGENAGRRADWPALDTFAVSRYCLYVPALPDEQQPYGAAMTGK